MQHLVDTRITDSRQAAANSCIILSLKYSADDRQREVISRQQIALERRVGISLQPAV